jgi:hypothetical protein
MVPNMSDSFLIRGGRKSDHDFSFILFASQNRSPFPTRWVGRPQLCQLWQRHLRCQVPALGSSRLDGKPRSARCSFVPRMPTPCCERGVTSSVTGYLKAVWPAITESVFFRFSAKLGFKFPERRVSSCPAGCTQNQPGKPIFIEFRGPNKLRPDRLQAPSLYLSFRPPPTQNFVRGLIIDPHGLPKGLRS